MIDLCSCHIGAQRRLRTIHIPTRSTWSRTRADTSRRQVIDENIERAHQRTERRALRIQPRPRRSIIFFLRPQTGRRCSDHARSSSAAALQRSGRNIDQDELRRRERGRGPQNQLADRRRGSSSMPTGNEGDFYLYFSHRVTVATGLGSVEGRGGHGRYTLRSLET